MKKFLGIVVLGLLFSGNAYANPVAFKCINIDGSEPEYILTIDLKKKLIDRAGVEYKIIKIEDTYLQAKNENDEFYNFLIFKRYTGRIQLQIWYKKKFPGAQENDQNLKEIVSYKCEKIKKLI